MIDLPGVLGVSTPATYYSQVRLGSNPLRLPGWAAHLRGLATAIHEISGL